MPEQPVRANNANDVSEGVEPCPFCGAHPHVSSGATGGWGRVECDSENCLVEPCALGSSEAQAIAAWNRRATLSPPLPSTGVEREAEELRAYYVVKSELAMHFGPAFDRTTTEAAKSIAARLAALSALPLSGDPI